LFVNKNTVRGEHFFVHDQKHCSWRTFVLFVNRSCTSLVHGDDWPTRTVQQCAHRVVAIISTLRYGMLAGCLIVY
jgi:hypothetical protein